MMEVAGNTPNWGACPYFNNAAFRGKLETHAEIVRVFPNEFGEEGLSLGEWMWYMESQNPDETQV